MISIVMSVYQAEKYLCRCLDSIRNQTLGDFEAILVNDGSADHSGEILAEYAAADSRFQVISHANMGGGASRNIAMAAARGEFLYFMDPDDRLHPQLFESARYFAERHQVDIVEFGHWNDAPYEMADILYESIESARFLLTDQPILRMKKRNFRYGIGYWSKLYRRSILANHRFLTHPDPDRKHIMSDLVHTVCIAADRPKTLILDRKFYYYTANPASVSRKALPLSEFDDWLIILDTIGEYLRRAGWNREMRYFQARIIPRMVRRLYRKILALGPGGEQDAALQAFGVWLRAMSDRQFFLRRGYQWKDYRLFRRLRDNAV